MAYSEIQEQQPCSLLSRRSINTRQSCLLSQRDSVWYAHGEEVVTTLLHAGNSLNITISGYIPMNIIFRILQSVNTLTH